jgi:hypothetical protein
MAFKRFRISWLLAVALLQDRVQAAERKPNIVVIMSDDQDTRLGSLDAQPYVRNTLMAEGILLDNHFATVAQCCPSRTSYLRGQAAHNTNLTHVAPPGLVLRNIDKMPCLTKALYFLEVRGRNLSNLENRTIISQTG